MTSLTVRNLPEDVKKRLRQRAAANGRSMEEEVRLLLAEGAADAAVPAKPAGKPGKPSASEIAARQILLIIAGGIAAYKSLDLIRRLRERGIAVRVVMTKAAQEFVTPLSVGALAGEKPFTDLFDQQSEFDVGHIRLARDTDLIVVAPATADLMAKMANGHADDLASAVLLATTNKVLLAPAMNPAMWANKATQRNLKVLRADGVLTVGPNAGEMAESGEAGTGRMAEPLEIVAAVEKLLAGTRCRKRGQAACRQAHRHHGGTDARADRSGALHREPFLRQAGLRDRARRRGCGRRVTLVSGPVTLPDPPGVKTVRVESARDMLLAVEAALPADVGIFAAAVADWRTAERRDTETEERRQWPAEARARGKSRYPRDGFQAQDQAPQARHRLCGRDRKGDRARQGEAQTQGQRLDRGERRLGAKAARWAATTTPCISSWRTASGRRSSPGRASRRTTSRGSRRAHRHRLEWKAAMSDVVVSMKRLPHGEGLAAALLPERQRRGSRPDRRRAGRCAAGHRARPLCGGADRHQRSRCRRARKRRCGRARASRCATA